MIFYFPQTMTPVLTRYSHTLFDAVLRYNSFGERDHVSFGPFWSSSMFTTIVGAEGTSIEILWGELPEQLK